MNHSCDSIINIVFHVCLFSVLTDAEELKRKIENIVQELKCVEYKELITSLIELFSQNLQYG